MGPGPRAGQGTRPVEQKSVRLWSIHQICPYLPVTPVMSSFLVSTSWTAIMPAHTLPHTQISNQSIILSISTLVRHSPTPPSKLACVPTTIIAVQSEFSSLECNITLVRDPA